MFTVLFENTESAEFLGRALTQKQKLDQASSYKARATSAPCRRSCKTQQRLLFDAREARARLALTGAPRQAAGLGGSTPQSHAISILARLFSVRALKSIENKNAPASVRHQRTRPIQNQNQRVVQSENKLN